MKQRTRLYRRAENLRTLIENINEYVFAVEFESGQPSARYHSPRCLALTGYSPEDFEAEEDLWYTIIHPEDRNLVDRFIKHIHTGKPQPPLEHRIIHRDGRTRWVCNTSVATFDGSGELTRIDGFLIDITDRKASQEALEKSELKYRTLAEQMTDTIAILGIQGEIRYFSPSGYALTGMTTKELEGKNAFDLVHPDDHPRLKRSMRNLLIGAPQARSEYRLIRKNGSWVWIETTSRPIRLDPGLPVIEILTVIREITERKKTEEQLRLTLDILDAEHEANFDGLISISHSDNRILSFNRRLSELLGIPAERLRGLDGNTFWQIVEPHFQPTGELEAFRRYLADHPTTEAHLQLTFDRKSTFECYSLPMQGHDGSLLGRVWRFRDITRQRTDELCLLESQQRLELALHGGNLGVWEQDLVNDDFFFDHRWAEILGYHVSELEPKFKTIHQLLHPDDLEQGLQTLRSALASPDGKFEYECRMKTKNGDWKMILTRARVVKRDAEGHPLRLSGTHMDVTESWRARRELQQAKRLLEEQNETLARQKAELEQTNRQLNEAIVEARRLARQADLANAAKSEFLANMSHEIRTPLNAIIGFSQLVQETTTDPQSKQRLEAVTSSGSNLLRLINDILDMSKIEAGAMEIRRESTDVTALLRDLQAVFSFQAQSRNIEFRLQADSQLPHSLLLDGAKIRQILFNLLGNAIKFTEQGSVTLEVRSPRRPANPEQDSIGLCDLEFLVRDTGCGIPAEDKELVFLPFRQRKGQNAGKFGGTGLGLTISRRLTEMMGGSITLKSEPGRGSEFSVKLPAIPILRQRDAATPDPTGHSGLKALPNLSGRRILVVDDVDLNRLLIRDFLKPLHPTVLEAENGEEALLSIAKARPDIVLMDLRMPKMDGYESLVEIRRRFPDLTVVALTASALEQDIARIRKAGFDGFVSKPVQRDLLLQELSMRLPVDDPAPLAQNRTCERLEVSESVSTTPPPKDSSGANLPHLFDMLANDMKERCDELRRRMILGETRDFAADLHDLGKRSGFPPLVAYASVLSLHAETCDFERLDSTLRKFPQLIEQWRTADHV